MSYRNVIEFRPPSRKSGTPGRDVSEVEVLRHGADFIVAFAHVLELDAAAGLSFHRFSVASRRSESLKRCVELLSTPPLTSSCTLRRLGCSPMRSSPPVRWPGMSTWRPGAVPGGTWTWRCHTSLQQCCAQSPDGPGVGTSQAAADCPGRATDIDTMARIRVNMAWRRRMAGGSEGRR